MSEKTHYGDEDPEVRDHDDDPAYDEELFELSRSAGYKPSQMRGDPEFGKRYAAWLEKHKNDKA